MFSRHQMLVNRLCHLRLTAAHQLSRLLAFTVFPPCCCLCGFPGESPDLDLCRLCREDLPLPAETPPGTVVSLSFQPPVDVLIRDLKYRGFMANARVLGVLLALAVRARGEPLPRLLIPVPLHVNRLRERGFNQATALARYAGRMLGVPHAASLVRRVRNTPSQTELSIEQRRLNVRGAFAVSGKRRRAGLLAAGHVAIVDDVITTGSTTHELRAILMAAGVAQVDVWAAAQVP